MSGPIGRSLLVTACLLAIAVRGAAAQGVSPQNAKVSRPKAQQTDTATKLEIYGFAQGDAIYDFARNDPQWFDVNRPTKLPSFQGEFGDNGRTWFSARQTRFGVKADVPTGGKPIFVRFEFDLFGVGVDAGQTTIRPRYMYGQWGKLGAGQLDSPFMDLDVFPNVLDYWGPNGMLFFRNVQVFWQPIKRADGTRATVALERPGASGDGGVYASRVELQDVVARFPAPDISAEYRWGQKWGYIEGAGILRWIRWDDLGNQPFDLAGGATGWGLSLSSNVNASKRDVLRFQVVYGEGVENYFNDAPVDIGIKNNPGDPNKPIKGVALPDLGLVGFLDHRWTSQFTSAIGWSYVNIDNSELQAPNDFHSGQYATINLLYYPVPAIMMGGEFQYGRRTNFRNDFTFNDYRLQFSFKYSYSQKFGGNHDVIRAQD